MSKNADYWRGRFSIIQDAAKREAGACVADLEQIYRDAELTVQADLERWYSRFAANNNVSLFEARKMLTTGQLEEFKWNVEQYIKIGQQANLPPEWLKKLENASARFHVGRLESIQLQIQQQIELLYGNQLDSVDSLLKEIISNGYTRTAYEIQKGIGLAWDITALDQRKLETLLSKPWTSDSRTFRDRCWAGKANLVGGVQSTLTQGLIRGDSPQKMTEAIMKKFGVSRYQAGRLVRTETTFFNVRSQLECFREIGVEDVEILETLDSYTCDLCAGMDKKVLPLSQCEAGITVPPFHPSCRGDVCPHIEDKDGKRIARNAEGEVYYVPADMNYKAWKDTFVDGGIKDRLTRVVSSGILNAQKKSKNEGSGVQTVGRIDIEKYRCITDDISTDEVIITDTQIRHIMDRHPGDYERFFGFFNEIISDPDYIIEANKPNTAILLKEVQIANESFKLVLRLAVSTDNPNYKNSIITFMKIDKKSLERLARNKKVLYKRE